MSSICHRYCFCIRIFQKSLNMYVSNPRWCLGSHQSFEPFRLWWIGFLFSFTRDALFDREESFRVTVEWYYYLYVEIGLEENHVHMLVQGISTMSVVRLVPIIKSLSAREIIRRHPKIKKEVLYGGTVWASG